MRSAITICLVPEARQGPFVFHDGLELGCRAAAEVGFDAVEIFPGSAADVPVDEVRRMVTAHGLSVAAVGTGAGWVKHRLHLCDPDAATRARACEFIAAIIDAAGDLGAPAIIGSMQGRTGEGVSHDAALAMLADALGILGERASRHGQPLLYEPLNRYETDLFTAQARAATFLELHGLHDVKLLCDLFHMNIEEADPAAALMAIGDRVGHVHWADSNRRAMGMGHTDPQPIVAALRSIGYTGFLSAEIFPLPTSLDAARQSIESFRTFAT
ncbi:MAG: sugar phosphate isomerase/epimerase [Planctomycetota bacterium]|jgi:sugar phosphate isomerase/epimerase|nr:sugar phosphate isomerase/epimerase [Planctomycetota bacterium]